MGALFQDRLTVGRNIRLRLRHTEPRAEFSSRVQELVQQADIPEQIVQKLQWELQVRTRRQVTGFCVIN
jgi:hypothetical protein